MKKFLFQFINFIADTLFTHWPFSLFSKFNLWKDPWVEGFFDIPPEN